MKQRRMIAVGEGDPATTSPAPAASEGDDSLQRPAPATPDCPLCGGDFLEAEPTTGCPDCEVLYHADCWAVNGRSCARLGCPGATASGGDRSQIPMRPPDDDGGELSLS